MERLTNIEVAGPLGQDRKGSKSHLLKNLSKANMSKYKKKWALTIGLYLQIWGPCLNLILNQENLTKKEIQTEAGDYDAGEGVVLQRKVEVGVK